MAHFGVATNGKVKRSGPGGVGITLPMLLLSNSPKQDSGKRDVCTERLCCMLLYANHCVQQETWGGSWDLLAYAVPE